MLMNCLTSLINGLIVTDSTFEVKSSSEFTQVEIWNSLPIINRLIQDVVKFYSLETETSPHYTTYYSNHYKVKIIAHENEL